MHLMFVIWQWIRVWEDIPAIPSHGIEMRELELEVSLDYVSRSCLQNKAK